MGLKKAESQVKILLAETILAMCRNTLNNHAEVNVEGLLGITLDNDEIFLVSINQSITNPDVPSKTKKQTVEENDANNVSETSQRKRGKSKTNDDSSSESDDESTRDSKAKKRRRKRKRRQGSRSSNESASSSESEENENYNTPSIPKVKNNENDLSENTNNFSVMHQEDTSLSNLSETVQIKQEMAEDEEEDIVIIKEEMADLPADNQFMNMQQQFESVVFPPDFSSSFPGTPQQSMSSDVSQPQPGPSSSNAEEEEDGVDGCQVDTFRLVRRHLEVLEANRAQEKPRRIRELQLEITGQVMTLSELLRAWPFIKSRLQLPPNPIGDNMDAIAHHHQERLLNDSASSVLPPSVPNGHQDRPESRSPQAELSTSSVIPISSTFNCASQVSPTHTTSHGQDILTSTNVLGSSASQISTLSIKDDELNSDRDNSILNDESRSTNTFAKVRGVENMAKSSCIDAGCHASLIQWDGNVELSKQIKSVRIVAIPSETNDSCRPEPKQFASKAVDTTAESEDTTAMVELSKIASQGESSFHVSTKVKLHAMHGSDSQNEIAPITNVSDETEHRPLALGPKDDDAIVDTDNQEELTSALVVENDAIISEVAIDETDFEREPMSTMEALDDRPSAPPLPLIEDGDGGKVTIRVPSPLGRSPCLDLPVHISGSFESSQCSLGSRADKVQASDALKIKNGSPVKLFIKGCHSQFVSKRKKSDSSVNDSGDDQCILLSSLPNKSIEGESSNKSPPKKRIKPPDTIVSHVVSLSDPTNHDGGDYDIKIVGQSVSDTTLSEKPVMTVTGLGDLGSTIGSQSCKEQFKSVVIEGLLKEDSLPCKSSTLIEPEIVKISSSAETEGHVSQQIASTPVENANDEQGSTGMNYSKGKSSKRHVAKSSSNTKNFESTVTQQLEADPHVKQGLFKEVLDREIGSSKIGVSEKDIQSKFSPARVQRFLDHSSLSKITVAEEGTNIVDYSIPRVELSYSKTMDVQVDTDKQKEAVEKLEELKDQPKIDASNVSGSASGPTLLELQAGKDRQRTRREALSMLQVDTRVSQKGLRGSSFPWPSSMPAETANVILDAVQCITDNSSRTAIANPPDKFDKITSKGFPLSGGSPQSTSSKGYRPNQSAISKKITTVSDQSILSDIRYRERPKPQVPSEPRELLGTIYTSPKWSSKESLQSSDSKTLDLSISKLPRPKTVQAEERRSPYLRISPAPEHRMQRYSPNVTPSRYPISRTTSPYLYSRGSPYSPSMTSGVSDELTIDLSSRSSVSPGLAHQTIQDRLQPHEISNSPIPSVTITEAPHDNSETLDLSNKPQSKWVNTNYKEKKIIMPSPVPQESWHTHRGPQTSHTVSRVMPSLQYVALLSPPTKGNASASNYSNSPGLPTGQSGAVSAPSNRTCQFCGKIFASRNAVVIHTVVHTGEKSFVCQVCGVSFNTKGNMVRHMQRKHNYPKGPGYASRNQDYKSDDN